MFNSGIYRRKLEEKQKLDEKLNSFLKMADARRSTNPRSLQRILMVWSVLVQMSREK
jgi:hypothetical protein